MISVGAFIKIPALLPITCQTLFVSLAGIVLGAKWGTVSVFVYILLGLSGLPVFSAGGGIFYVLQPTFGYIIGFLAMSFITGKLSSNKTNQKSLFLSALAGNVAVYVIGIAYFYLISRFYLGQATEIRALFINCFLITLPGDIAMCILSSLIGARVKKTLNKVL